MRVVAIWRRNLWLLMGGGEHLSKIIDMKYRQMHQTHKTVLKNSFWGICIPVIAVPLVPPKCTKCFSDPPFHTRRGSAWREFHKLPQMMITYDDRIWSSYRMIICNHHHAWRSNVMVIYDQHTCWSYITIIYDPHIWSSYMVTIHDVPIWWAYMMIICDRHRWWSHVIII